MATDGDLAKIFQLLTVLAVESVEHRRETMEHRRETALGFERVGRGFGRLENMAHAHAELTGETAVAMVTAGPGVTNTVTAIANASIARSRAPDRGMPAARASEHGCAATSSARRYPAAHHTLRYARTARVAEQVMRELDEAVARANGDCGERGPAYIEIPTDVLRTDVSRALVLDEWLASKAPRETPPHPGDVAAAVEALWSARWPVFRGDDSRTNECCHLSVTIAPGRAHVRSHRERQAC